MRIMINDKMGFKRLDDKNIIVFEVKKRFKKDTNEPYDLDEVLGYHSTIESAIRSIQKKLQIDLKSNSIEELINEIKALNKVVYDRLQGLDI